MVISRPAKGLLLQDNLELLHVVIVQVGLHAQGRPGRLHLPGDLFLEFLKEGQILAEFLFPQYLLNHLQVRFEKVPRPVEVRHHAPARFRLQVQRSKTEGAELAVERKIGIEPLSPRYHELGKELGQVAVDPDALHKVPATRFPDPCLRDQLLHIKGRGSVLSPLHAAQGYHVGVHDQSVRAVYRSRIIGAPRNHLMILRTENEVKPQVKEVQPVMKPKEPEKRGPEYLRRVKQVPHVLKNPRNEALQLRDQVPQGCAVLRCRFRTADVVVYGEGGHLQGFRKLEKEVFRLVEVACVRHALTAVLPNYRINFLVTRVHADHSVSLHVLHLQKIPVIGTVRKLADGVDLVISDLARYSYGMNRYLAVFVALFLTVSLYGQDRRDAYAFIIYAEGYDLSIHRNGELSTFDVLVDNVVGMPLLAGDLVQTDADTFVEIQVMPSRTVVKVAENTTFEIERLGGSGGGTFNMTYGRLRARVERVAQQDPFEVRGFSAVASVRGTDFGFDSVVERESASELRTRVYVFEGEVDVSDRPPEGLPEEVQTVRVAANQMVNVTTEIPEFIRPSPEDPDVPPTVEAVPGDERPEPVPVPVRRVVFRQEEIEPEIQEFWQRETFREEPVDPDLVDERFPGINARVQQLSEERRRFEELQRLRREGLLAPPEELLAEAEGPLEMEPLRQPVGVELEGPRASDRAQRLIMLPQEEISLGRQTRLAGHWLLGLGITMELAGAATAWFGQGYRSFSDLEEGGPGVAMMTGGGVFITSGLISYLISIIAD